MGVVIVRMVQVSPLVWTAVGMVTVSIVMVELVLDGGNVQQ